MFRLWGLCTQLILYPAHNTTTSFLTCISSTLAQSARCNATHRSLAHACDCTCVVSSAAVYPGGASRASAVFPFLLRNSSCSVPPCALRSYFNHDVQPATERDSGDLHRLEYSSHAERHCHSRHRRGCRRRCSYDGNLVSVCRWGARCTVSDHCRLV